ncbi:hypothetical protein [Deinococcus seoulensis]|nr:hypothetical protein [Deinococcus seoulensis]
MLRKFMQLLGRATLEPSVLTATAQATFGEAYAADLHALHAGYLKEEATLKRAQGVLALTRAVHTTRPLLGDPDRHHHLWAAIARPSIDWRYQAALSGQYDPARWYVDAFDFAAAMTTLPSMFSSRDTPVAAQLIDVLTGLNTRDGAAGGYFGHTPYWPLHDYPYWRAVDREFTSVQMYWLALLAADQTSAQLHADLMQLLLTSDLTEVDAWSPVQRDRVFNTDLPALTQGLALGALSFSAAKPQHANSTRARALRTLLSARIPDAEFAFAALMQSQGINRAVPHLKGMFPLDHPIQTLPDQHFTLQVRLGAALSKLLSLVGLVDDLLELPRTQAVLNDPRGLAPHLLHASL